MSCGKIIEKVSCKISPRIVISKKNKEQFKAGDYVKIEKISEGGQNENNVRD